MPTIKVGDGHTSPDYLTSQLAWDTLSGTDQGGDVIAECLGYCGIFTPTGSAVNLFHFKPAFGIVNDGKNETQLPTMERCSFSQASQIVIDDIKIFTNNQWVTAFSLSSNFVTSNRCIFDNTTTAYSVCFQINGNYTNSSINNFVVRGGSSGINGGYLAGTNFNNGIVYGAANFGVKGSAGGTAGGNILRLNNVFVFNNGTDFDTSANVFINNCASQDTTGTIGLTGYTSVELVDFANNDYRIKATSQLATASSTGSYIGAFVEQASATESYSGSISGNVSFSTELTTEKQAFRNIDIAINNFSELIAKKSIFNAIDALQYFTTSISSHKSLSSNVLSNNTFSTEISSEKLAYASVSSTALFSVVIAGTAAEIISKFGAINTLNYFSPEIKGLKKSNSSIVSTSSFYVTNSGKKVSFSSVDNLHSVVTSTFGYKSANIEVNTQISFNTTIYGVNTEIAYTTIVRTISINSDIVSVEINTNSDNTLVINSNIMSEINISGQI